MRLGIKGKQVLGVTSIVGVVVVIVSVLHLARLASVSLDESRARADLRREAAGLTRLYAEQSTGSNDPLGVLGVLGSR